VIAAAFAAAVLSVSVALLGHTSPLPASFGARADQTARHPGASEKLPLSFVPNRGQADPRSLYQAQGGGLSLFFGRRHVALAFNEGKRGAALDLRFIGANPDAQLVPGDRGKGVVNYVSGSDPAKRRVGLPTYGQLVYRDLWPGIDMVFSGRRDRLEYSFRLTPGADPARIRMQYAGASSLALGARGALRINTPLGALEDARPLSYQRIRGRRRAVESRFRLTGETSYGLEVGSYDRRRPLVIDPALVYSTFLGGSGDRDYMFDAAADSQGNAYLAGQSDSADYPTTPGAYDTTYNGPLDDIVVTKLNPTGSALVYSTYIGGSNGQDYAQDIAIDAAGNAYASGIACSTGLATPGAYQPTVPAGSGCARFIVKLNAAGSNLDYFTYFGADYTDPSIADIAVDGQGNVYFAGGTSRQVSLPFPVTANAYDHSWNGLSDAYIAKLNASGSALVYSTYLGGPDYEDAGAIAVDGQGAAYVVGTTSGAFPVTESAYDPFRNDFNGDAFIAKLSPSGSSLVYATYLGGSTCSGSGSGCGIDQGGAIAVDSQGAAYVGGRTYSSDYPTTPGAYDPTFNGGPDGDAFVTKINSTGTGLDYSTYLGGSGPDVANGIAVDGSGSAWVIGSTEATNFPTTADALRPVKCAGNDGFLAQLDAAGSALAYSTFLGCGYPNGLAVDGLGGTYVAGSTGTASFPTTTGAYDRTFAGMREGFVWKLDAGAGAASGAALSPSSEQTAFSRDLRTPFMGAR
jgi:hypothetical protein